MSEHIEEFVCIACWLHFECPESEQRCPECGDSYGHFFTGLRRANSFALMYALQHKKEKGDTTKIRSIVPKRKQLPDSGPTPIADGFARKAQREAAQRGEGQT